MPVDFTEFLTTITDVDIFTWLVVLGLVGAVFALLHMMTESWVLGVCFTPFLIIGALTSRHIILMNALSPVSDKDTAIVMAVAGGVIPTLVALLIVTRIFNMVTAFRNRNSRAGLNSLLAKRIAAESDHAHGA